MSVSQSCIKIGLIRSLDFAVMGIREVRFAVLSQILAPLVAKLYDGYGRVLQVQEWYEPHLSLCQVSWGL